MNRSTSTATVPAPVESTTEMMPPQDQMLVACLRGAVELGRDLAAKSAAELGGAVPAALDRRLDPEG
jgi:hypothetical protein